MLQPPSALPIEPFQRLRVSDGLLLTAERWRIAHDYHRKRQNIYYQSLNQAGIVAGLGVCVTAAPETIAQEHRDGRWLQIQPGVAIDGFGNPIVVPEPITFRIASPAPLDGELMVYLTLRYVDPERLQGLGDRDLVQETFRIDEITRVPTPNEVELCRICLPPGEINLRPALDIWHPTVNSLDLRFRQIAQARPVQQVAIAQAVSESAPWLDATVTDRLQSLLQSLPVLSPMMQGDVLPPLNLTHSDTPLLPIDLLYLTWRQLLALTVSEKFVLQRYAAAGTVLLVETGTQEASIVELSLIRQQLKEAIASVAKATDSAEMRRDLATELAAVDIALNEQLQSLMTTLQACVAPLGITVDTPSPLSREHPLRHTPFLFAQLPCIEGYPVQLFNWGSLVLCIGSLSQAWGLDDDLILPRETIRTAQEMGINLLHYSWRQHQLTQLQQVPGL
ncbi:hypothetical protein [Pantanalinema sp. GBBB05]|uniref:hypothetical protein n=1 Tax=Pantanalinema sp. GBBB05 TaxID=2604139 RepID=UPI001D4A14F9|nr:hypothetical protein [Pantanalinema sp. GBBB05]